MKKIISILLITTLILTQISVLGVYAENDYGIVKICAVKKYPKFDFATYRTSIAVTTINSFLEFCQGRRRRLF